MFSDIDGTQAARQTLRQRKHSYARMYRRKISIAFLDEKQASVCGCITLLQHGWVTITKVEVEAHQPLENRISCEKNPAVLDKEPSKEAKILVPVQLMIRLRICYRDDFRGQLRTCFSLLTSSLN